MSYCRAVTLSHCHPVALSPCRAVTLSHCHPVALSPCRTVALSHCQVSLAGSPLARYGSAKYENLFIGALREYGMLCLGLYRYLDLSDSPSAATARKIRKTKITSLMYVLLQICDHRPGWILRFASN